MLIDTHTHYNDEAFAEDRDELIQSLVPAGISKAVNIGADIVSSMESVELANQYEHIYASIGVHPSSTGDMCDKDLNTLEELSGNPKIVAIGEIGLDYYWDEADRETQKKWFNAQIELAKKLNLSIVIHSRDAARDTFDIMKAADIKNTDVVMHCYSYSLEMAKEFMKLGVFFGIGGVSTFKNAKKTAEVIEYLPIERIVLETDCPYLAPVPFRGKRNSSLYLPYIVKRISELKGLSEEYVMEMTEKNAYKLYPRLGKSCGKGGRNV